MSKGSETKLYKYCNTLNVIYSENRTVQTNPPKGTSWTPTPMPRGGGELWDRR